MDWDNGSLQKKLLVANTSDSSLPRSCTLGHQRSYKLSFLPLLEILWHPAILFFFQLRKALTRFLTFRRLRPSCHVQIRQSITIVDVISSVHCKDLAYPEMLWRLVKLSLSGSWWLFGQSLKLIEFIVDDQPSLKIDDGSFPTLNYRQRSCKTMSWDC